MINLDFIITCLVSGLFMGISSTFGNWLINRGIIKRLEKLEKNKEKP